MPIGQDTLSHVSLAVEDTDLILTVFFTGGPITGLVSLGSDQHPLAFAADPFFRRQENYITSGSVFISTGGAADPNERRRAISILFTNASAVAATYRLELSSPRKLNFSEAAAGSDSPARLIAKAGTVPPRDSAQFVIIVEHP